MMHSEQKVKLNKEMFDKFKSPDIVTVCTVHRLEWLGHGVKMDGERTVKKLLEGKPGRGRGKGRPTLRWVDDVELAVRNMGVKGWRTRILDRTEWASVVREAKARLKVLKKKKNFTPPCAS
jgi:hypothetical protein